MFHVNEKLAAVFSQDYYYLVRNNTSRSLPHLNPVVYSDLFNSSIFRMAWSLFT